ncbi:hypothetical protein ASZ90_011077 [hydrocarbon metagenome]|uniref:Uncharacterized protein n=1 Tax=hydrocarbon metagenome TaxID=938273 RepID=A0A0W8FEC6_9ZZZZ
MVEAPEDAMNRYAGLFRGSSQASIAGQHRATEIFCQNEGEDVRN